MIRLPRACRGRTAVWFPANSSHMCCVELAIKGLSSAAKGQVGGRGWNLLAFLLEDGKEAGSREMDFCTACLQCSCHRFWDHLRASFYIDLFTACLDDLEVQSDLLNCPSLSLSIDDATSCDGPISSSRLMQLSLSWLRARLRAPMAYQWSFMLFSGICLVGILWTFLILLWRLASSLFLIVSHSLPWFSRRVIGWNTRTGAPLVSLLLIISSVLVSWLAVS